MAKIAFFIFLGTLLILIKARRSSPNSAIRNPSELYTLSGSLGRYSVRDSREGNDGITSAIVKATKAPMAAKLMKNHNMRRLKKVGFAISLFVRDLRGINEGLL